MVSNKAFSLGEKVAKISDFCQMWGKKACYARHFDLLRNSHSTVPPVRRRVRVACLDGSFDLCQSVKKEFFDRLKQPPAIYRWLLYSFHYQRFSSAAVSAAISGKGSVSGSSSGSFFSLK